MTLHGILKLTNRLTISLVKTIWTHYFGKGPHIKQWNIMFHITVNLVKTWFMNIQGLRMKFIRSVYDFLLQSSAKGCKTTYLIVPRKFRKAAHDLVKAESIKRYGDYFFEELDSWESAKDLQITCTIPNGLIGRDDKKGVYFNHGGGFMIGHPKIYHSYFGEMAKRANCQVWALDYRMSPEVCLPAIFEDLIAGYLYLTGDFTEEGLGINAGDIVAGGDSAGGCMTAWLNHFLRDTGLNQVGGAFMWSPLLDLSISQPSFYDKMPNDILTNHPSKITYISDDYSLENTMDYLCYYGSDDKTKQKIIKNGGPAAPRSISSRDLYNPLGNSNYSNLPPLLIIAGEEEFLRDDGYLYAKKVFESNIKEKSNQLSIPTQILQIYEGMPHDFAILPFSPFKSAAILRTANFIKLCLYSKINQNEKEIRKQVSDIDSDLGNSEFGAYYYKFDGSIKVYTPNYKTVEVPVLTNKQ